MTFLSARHMNAHIQSEAKRRVKEAVQTLLNTPSMMDELMGRLEGSGLFNFKREEHEQEAS